MSSYPMPPSVRPVWPFYPLPPPPPPKRPNPLGAWGFAIALIGILGLMIVGVVLWTAQMRIMQEEMFQSLGSVFSSTTAPATNPGRMFQGMYQSQSNMERRIREFESRPAVQAPLWISMLLSVAGLVLSIAAMNRRDAKRGLAVSGLVIGIVSCACGGIGSVSMLVQLLATPGA